MKRILLFADAIIMYFFDPMMQQLQHWTQRSNFWLAKKFIDGLHVAFAGYAIFLICNTKFVFLGTFLLCVNVIILSALSIRVWKFLMKKIGKKFRRHTFQRERDRGMYYSILENTNPALVMLERYRLRRLIEVCVLTALLFVIHVFDSTLLLITIPTVLYAVSITLWLYMRSATTITNGQSSQQKKQVKTLHLLQLV